MKFAIVLVGCVALGFTLNVYAGFPLLIAIAIMVPVQMIAMNYFDL